MKKKEKEPSLPFFFSRSPESFIIISQKKIYIQKKN